MKQLILVRHAARIDKDNMGKGIDTSSWLANYDPPLDLVKSQLQITQIDNLLPVEGKEIVIHSSPYNRCVQTAELLLPVLSQTQEVKFRVDQALSEWLNFNFNLNFLPPNDNGISLLHNINQYLYQTGSHLHRDMNWDSYKFGKPGEYGEEYEVFKRRCLKFLNALLAFYENSDKIVVVVSHGAVISVLLQIILHKPFFKEIPLCEPVVLNKLNQNLFQFESKIPFLAKYEKQIYKLKDLRIPVEYETNMFIDHAGDSEYSSEEDESDVEEEGVISFNVTRNRSNTTGSMIPRHVKAIASEQQPLGISASERNFHDLKKKFFDTEDTTDLVADKSVHNSDEEISLHFASSSAAPITKTTSSTTTTPLIPNDDKTNLQKLLFSDGSSNNLYKINEEEDYWFGFNR